MYHVATVLTVYGIETHYILHSSQMHCCELQQYLPFTVLKPFWNTIRESPSFILLQQYLPFTVLKHIDVCVLNEI